MQIKNKRDFTLIECLESTLNMVPIEKRLGLSIEFTSSEELLKENLEAIYTLATQRLLHLSYYLEWSRSIEANKGKGLEPIEESNFDYVLTSFHNFEEMKPEVVKFFNESFVSWINHQVVRELNEFFKVYLMELYETCAVLKNTETPITPSDTVKIRKECREFEDGGIQKRLYILRNKFGFEITHNREILSLYKVRNIFSHHDGIVDKKHCNKAGYLEVIWPKNKFRFKKKGRNEWVSYEKARKPFSSKDYESVEVTWLEKPEIRRHKPKDQIRFSYKDLNDLIFFYLYVFNELHSKLVDIAKSYNFKVRNFKEYIATFDSFTFVSTKEIPDKQ